MNNYSIDPKWSEAVADEVIKIVKEIDDEEFPLKVLDGIDCIFDWSKDELEEDEKKLYEMYENGDAEKAAYFLLDLVKKVNKDDKDEKNLLLSGGGYFVF